MHAATHVENNIDSTVEVTSCSQNAGKKTSGIECFCDIWLYLSTYKSQVAFMGLDFEYDKPKMNAVLRVMIVEP